MSWTSEDPNYNATNYAHKLSGSLKDLHFHRPIDEAQRKLLSSLSLCCRASDFIKCRVMSSTNNNKCGYHLDKGRYVAGWIEISHLAENYTISEEQCRDILQAITKNFMCTQKHQNDNTQRTRLFEEWYPVVLRYREDAKNQLLQQYLTPLEEKIEAQSEQLNSLMRKCRSGSERLRRLEDENKRLRARRKAEDYEEQKSNRRPQQIAAGPPQPLAEPAGGMNLVNGKELGGRARLLEITAPSHPPAEGQAQQLGVMASDYRAELDGRAQQMQVAVAPRDPEEILEGLTPAQATLLVKVMIHTGMTVEYSKQCLNDTGWTYDAAITGFETVKRTVPSEAFIATKAIELS